MKLLSALLFLVVPPLHGATSESVSPPQRVGFPAPPRPRDPWVFRSVLDLHTRMVTIALHDEMWAAYDLETCGLYKIWRGGVSFTGSVYDTVHGPQPTSHGPEYTRGVEGPVWFAFVQDKPANVEARYESYLFEQNHIVFKWELTLEDGRKAHVAEGIEFVRPEDMGFTDDRIDELGLTKGDPGVWRSFNLLDGPEDAKFDVYVETSGTHGPKLCDYAEREKLEDTKSAKGEVVSTRFFAHVPVLRQRPMNNLLMFFTPREMPKSAAKPEGK